jgi:hypothetical protein
MLRFFVALISLGLALFCGGEAYIVHSMKGNWLLGSPVRVWTYTFSNETAAQVLGLLAIAFLLLAAYAFFGSKSEK